MHEHLTVSCCNSSALLSSKPLNLLHHLWATLPTPKPTLPTFPNARASIHGPPRSVRLDLQASAHFARREALKETVQRLADEVAQEEQALARQAQVCNGPCASWEPTRGLNR